MKKIAVIGCGNMAGAVVRSMYKGQKIKNKYLTYTPSRTRAIELAKEVEGEAIVELKEAVDADYFLIGCKPQQFEELSKMFKDIDLSNKVVISIMAGIDQERISNLLGTSKVIRLMPSLPMEHGEGICLLSTTEQVEESDIEFLKEHLNDSSMILNMKTEELFDQVTVVSASGPAFIYYFMNALEDSLKEWGLGAIESRAITSQLFRGSAKSALINCETELDELIAKVTSKKGVTIEAIDSFRQNGIDAFVKMGVDKAIDRSSQLRKG
ncbi:putative pyrroline-5-carboxylate reductase [Bacteriovorax sp. BAL6_X]|uniref:pyrroline-5-carboxylate reductase family protein n=1 Tax=Bacteriovorax sp. BAL6_X TaxID=1201290 RepID=UPI0003866B80|nr:pyrroline-5-carboxylate reductase dimerization domain-containing protein [Bacteriovorax sp. BAL6_X]EPZ49782.1 putative pyrroline-5-carboxylate reductase [Bacteriovorax sp. BAL6_X]